MAKPERIAKINAEIERQLANIIRGLNNPELENIIISVTRADTSADLSVTKAYISIFGDSQTQDRVMAILNNAKGYIRRELGHAVDLRIVPDIVFVLDDSQEYSENINRLLEQIKDKNKSE